MNSSRINLKKNYVNSGIGIDICAEKFTNYMLKIISDGDDFEQRNEMIFRIPACDEICLIE
jgi:hypothetical protein